MKKLNIVLHFFYIALEVAGIVFIYNQRYVLGWFFVFFGWALWLHLLSIENEK
jgi:hypothetical protein